MTATVPRVRVSVSARKRPPEVLRLDRVATVVSRASAEVPRPVPALRRRPAAMTSAPPKAEPASVMAPAVAVRATLAAVVMPPRIRSVAAVSAMSPSAVVRRLSSAWVIAPVVAVRLIVPVPAVVISAVAARVRESEAITLM